MEWILLILDKYGLWFIRGAGVTMLIAVTSTIAGSCVGLLIGSVKTIPPDRSGGLSKRFPFKAVLLKTVRFVLNIYIEVFRGTPMIVQAIVIYYGSSEAWGLDFSPMQAAILVVSLNTGAYMSEIVRGGIEAIDPGQTEAAQAIGMTHWQTMWNIILPQAIRNILPATGNEFVINIKDTSVLNVISVTELYFMTSSVRGAIYRTYETFLITGLIYLFLTFTTTRVLRAVERKLDGPVGYTLASSTMPESFMARKR